MSLDTRSLYIGFDPREAAAFAVARESAKRHLPRHYPVRGLILDEMRAQGLYTRPTTRSNGRLFDEISEHPMATEFAISRFLTPILAGEGLAMFTDCDVMFRANLVPIFDHAAAHPEIAVHCVKHKHEPKEGVKMDNQVQSRYSRKNWSSVMIFNCEHKSNRKLTVDLINEVPGRDLHAFCWLKDHEIGPLPPECNYLVGHTVCDESPDIVHFTDGIPTMPGYEGVEFADEFRAIMNGWAR
jgi:hypothetical protein